MCESSRCAEPNEKSRFFISSDAVWHRKKQGVSLQMLLKDQIEQREYKKRHHAIFRPRRLSHSNTENRQSYLLRCLQNDCCTLSERNLSARYVVSHPGSEKSVRRQMSKRAGERWDRCGYGGQNAPRSRLGQEQVWRLVHSHKLCNIFLIRQISHDCDDPRNENQSGPVRSY